MAIELARHYGAVILSADSRQFYREMNIGTAKPTEAELALVKHYFINTKNVGELYGAGHYEKDVMSLLPELFKERDIVLMAGGSGLYIDAVVHGVDEFEEVPPAIREQLNLQFRQKGLNWLQEELKKQDSVYFSQVDVNNPQRMIRALEVIAHSGKPFSSFSSKPKTPRNFTVVGLQLNTLREKLYERINQRVDGMMKEGLLEEVKSLNSYRNFNALKTVGYKELFDFLDGKLSLETATELIKQHTRNYAKRQITWFKNKGDYEQFEPDELEKIKAYIDLIISHG